MTNAGFTEADARSVLAGMLRQERAAARAMRGQTKPGPWQIIADPSCKTLEVMRWRQADRDATGYLSSEREIAPVRFRKRSTAEAWIARQCD